MTEPWLVYWVWMAGALVLAILQVALPGYMMLGFAIGGILTGFILLIPGLEPSLHVLLLIFAVLSLIAWIGLRYMFALPTGQVTTFDHDIND